MINRYLFVLIFVAIYMLTSCQQLQYFGNEITSRTHARSISTGSHRVFIEQVFQLMFYYVCNCYQCLFLH